MTTALVDGDTLYCKACDSYKVKTDFHKDSSSRRGHTYYCKTCATSKARKWHKDNTDNDEYKQAKRNSYFKTKYNLTLEERISLLREQEGACAICSTPLNPFGTHTHTDHDHRTGKVRGILCTNCNRGLGHFKDNIKFLESAMNYLQGNT
jgi:Recombination endonuclease VII